MSNHVVFHDSFSLVGEVEVARLERQLGFGLPEDYRAFLLKQNGGRPHPKYFPITNSPFGNFGILDILYGIKKGEYDDISNMLRVFRGRVPSSFLPIGCDPGGNQICMHTSSSDYGKIYFWDHEMGEEEEDDDDDDVYESSVTLKNISLGKPGMYFVANSFQDLLENLIPTLPD